MFQGLRAIIYLLSLLKVRYCKEFDDKAGLSLEFVGHKTIKTVTIEAKKLNEVWEKSKFQNMSPRKIFYTKNTLVYVFKRILTCFNVFSG